MYEQNSALMRYYFNLKKIKIKPRDVLFPVNWK